jgi:hypothetical protein
MAMQRSPQGDLIVIEFGIVHPATLYEDLVKRSTGAFAVFQRRVFYAFAFSWTFANDIHFTKT